MSLGLASHAFAAVDLWLCRFRLRGRSLESFWQRADQDRRRGFKYRGPGGLYHLGDSLKRADPNRARMVDLQQLSLVLFVGSEILLMRSRKDSIMFAQRRHRKFRSCPDAFHAKAGRPRFRPMLENLEDRTLLSMVPPQMLADINPGPGDSMTGESPVAINGTVFFTASDGVHGSELWKTDGTSAG